jgi:hypothetical protein
MHVRDLDDNEYELEDEARYQPDPDPVSVAVGAAGFATRHVVDDCREEFPESRVSRFPETFDRFYWEPQRVLVDILEDASPEQVREERERKRCDFKAAWCAEHGWRYLALTATDAQDAQTVRELLFDLGDRPQQAQHEVVARGEAPAPRRGQVQRPKATA